MEKYLRETTTVSIMSAVRIKLLKFFLIFDTCSKTELLRNTAHHKIQSTLANLFRMKKFEVYSLPKDLLDLETQNRRVDTVVIDRKKNKGFVFDHTIRQKTNVEIQETSIMRNGRFKYLLCRIRYNDTGIIIEM